MDQSEAQRWMVDAQVRTNDVTMPPLIAAMRRIPREPFVPAALAGLAYSEAELTVAPGRTLMRPRDLAKLIQLASPAPGERALEIAGASGYGAALLAAMGCSVVTLDPDPELQRMAKTALETAGFTTAVAACTPCAAGWPDGAPYDVILLHGAAEIVPDAWLAQLADGGRLCVIVRQGAAGAARIYTRAGGATAFRIAFDASPPVAPGLAAPVGFKF